MTADKPSLSVLMNIPARYCTGFLGISVFLETLLRWSSACFEALYRWALIYVRRSAQFIPHRHSSRQGCC
jgi:hypothetical protein